MIKEVTTTTKKSLKKAKTRKNNNKGSQEKQHCNKIPNRTSAALIYLFDILFYSLYIYFSLRHKLWLSKAC